MYHTLLVRFCQFLLLHLSPQYSKTRRCKGFAALHSGAVAAAGARSMLHSAQSDSIRLNP